MSLISAQNTSGLTNRSESSTSSLSYRLSSLIANIERSAKTAQIISINAGVIAVKTRTATNESYAFEAVADQIKEISEKSITGIQGLRSIIGEFRKLTATINIAGRQRMITQKVMKLFLVLRVEGHNEAIAAEMREAMQLFESTLDQLKGSDLNTPAINQRLLDARGAWLSFKDSLLGDDLSYSIESNNRVLRVMIDVVSLYEELVGDA